MKQCSIYIFSFMISCFVDSFTDLSSKNKNNQDHEEKRYMGKTGVANLPLHGGKAPRWLFQRMVALSKGVTEVLIDEYGSDEFLRRLSDPFWFQAFSCVLGYDWHSSGTTTVTCGALKEALNPLNLGVVLCGGKGNASRNTLAEIKASCEQYNLSSSLIDRLQYCSRMAAKVDNCAIQDGHTLYHHVFVLSERKKWAVIQQGMNDEAGYARRYHWLSDEVQSFICEPHSTIIGDSRQDSVLNMTAKQSSATQKISVDLVNDHPVHLQRDWASLTLHHHQRTLDEWISPINKGCSYHALDMPRSINWRRMKEIYDVHPTSYEDLLSQPGIGSRTIRALALISDLIYGEHPSWEDPIRYTFAHGGKDGVPHPVDLPTYAQSIQTLADAIEEARLGQRDKLLALRRLQNLQPPLPLDPSNLTANA